MKTSRRALVGVVLASFATTVLPAATPSAPAGKWAINYGEDLCTLSRKFGDPVKPVTLALIPSPRGRSLRVITMSPDQTASNSFSPGTIEVSSVKTPFKSFLRSGPAATGGSFISAGVEQAGFLRALETGTTLTIRSQGPPVLLNIDAGAAAVSALSRCVSDLLARWGMDNTAQALAATLPGEGVLALFGPADYPVDALRDNRQGDVGVRYWVEADGKMSGCRVIWSSGTPSLDAMTCSVINTRGHLDPARDSAGNSVRSLGSAMITWAIPN